jgi:molecular chaperone GrpE
MGDERHSHRRGVPDGPAQTRSEQVNRRSEDSPTPLGERHSEHDEVEQNTSEQVRGPEQTKSVQPSLQERLAAAEAEAAEHLDRLQRLAAEFDNYRKRAAREQEAIVTRAHERLVKELLPVLDDLERALQAADEHEEAKLEDGVRLVHRALADVLRKEGVEEIATEGAFDPHVHEALLAQPGDGVESGDVLQVLQKGYRLGDKVVRPARVIVAE